MTDGNGQLLLACVLNYRMSPVLAGACPTLFLATHSPGPVAHTSALTRQFLPRPLVARSWLEAERPLLHADHTHFSSARPDFKPSYARGKSALDAFLRSLTVV